MTRSSVLCALVLCIAACGPSVRDGSDDDPNAPCEPGTVEECYSGQAGTEGVGPCHAGTRTCTDQKLWTQCEGEVVPVAESCADAVDNNCNGMTDEDVDADGDGFTTCGGDCCDSTECSAPGLVNPGAFDAPGNNLDDDCNGVADDTQLLCDQGIASNTTNAVDFAKAIDICQEATAADKKWGVISAKLTLADGTGVPVAKSHAVRPRFGSGVLPQGGVSLALLSTGAAASKGDANPAWQDFQSGSGLFGNNTESNFPSDFLQANGGQLPNAPGCPGPDGNKAEDPVMLTLEVRVPTNAKSFKLSTNFFSSEFPEYTCSPFNDFFVVLLDSAFAGSPANPTDKNLAFYTPMGGTQKYPVGVNLASGNTGLFTQCVNGATGCSGNAGSINTCIATDQLAGTGLDAADPGSCDANAKQGGGTGWLVTSGNVNGGEIIKLRIAIWDTSDHALDSIAAIDGFQWSVDVAQPGTVIFKQEH
ncbi:MAG TPA: choice-of-anchor L domain-containing protein [Kofleriaceae bacterium]|nr:choice-of-anchor L domain-containing protein [Kofleriaceae bacterium]